MLDRLALLAPDWPERNPADLGIALVELLAYVGDYLSYQQDAVATEAYLGTARRRVSVRRHARLVDYAMHDGCNARAWVQVDVAGVRSALETGPAAHRRGAPPACRRPRPCPGSAEHERALRERPEVFETDARASISAPAHNELPFYAWGDARVLSARRRDARDAARPRSPTSTRATCSCSSSTLGPRTGAPSDADPSHRHAVRLTRVAHRQRSAGRASPRAADERSRRRRRDRVGVGGRAAVPALCLVASPTRRTVLPARRRQRGARQHRARRPRVDHRRRAARRDAGPQPVPRSRREPRALRSPSARSRDAALPAPARRGTAHPDRDGRRIELVDGQARERILAFDPAAPAAAALRWQMADVLPASRCTSGTATRDWTARRDLLDSDVFAGRLRGRGRGRRTRRPALRRRRARHQAGAGSVFTATYRVGNGRAGNVGAGADRSRRDALTARITGGAATRCRPRGGADPESLEHVAPERAPGLPRRRSAPSRRPTTPRSRSAER